MADPERTLSIAYAPAAIRPALTALFALDERFGAIVASTTEPMIGLMRLAWWREALEKLDRDPAPAEPLLLTLAQEVLPRGVSGAMLAGIEDGWAALVDGELEAAAIARHGRERGAGLFACAWRVLRPARCAELVSASIPPPARSSLVEGWTPKQVPGDDEMAVIGQGWALADLGHRHSDPTVRAEARRQARDLLDGMGRARWPVAARPLAALAMLACRDAYDKGVRAQGSPGRLLRMLAMRMLGR